MANEKTGIEKLREYLKWRDDYTALAPEWLAGRKTTKGLIDELVDQIEREHDDELAAAKRDMTDDAREVVERLRGMDCECLSCELRRRLIDALGIDIRHQEEGANVRMRRRLIELIEHGSKPDVDVEALRALADELDDMPADGGGR